ncbi:hypothetical protein ACUH88_07685 [Dermabacteraceae bacterium P13095]
MFKAIEIVSLSAKKPKIARLPDKDSLKIECNMSFSLLEDRDSEVGESQDGELSTTEFSGALAEFRMSATEKSSSGNSPLLELGIELTCIFNNPKVLKRAEDKDALFRECHSELWPYIRVLNSDLLAGKLRLNGYELPASPPGLSLK